MKLLRHLGRKHKGKKELLKEMALKRTMLGIYCFVCLVRPFFGEWLHTRPTPPSPAIQSLIAAVAGRQLTDPETIDWSGNLETVSVL